MIYAIITTTLTTVIHAVSFLPILVSFLLRVYVQANGSGRVGCRVARLGCQVARLAAKWLPRFLGAAEWLPSALLALALVGRGRHRHGRLQRVRRVHQPRALGADAKRHRVPSDDAAYSFVEGDKSAKFGWVVQRCEAVDEPRAAPTLRRRVRSLFVLDDDDPPTAGAGSG